RTGMREPCRWRRNPKARRKTRPECHARTTRARRAWARDKREEISHGPPWLPASGIFLERTSSFVILQVVHSSRARLPPSLVRRLGGSLALHDSATVSSKAIQRSKG